VRDFNWVSWLLDIRAFWVVVALYSIVPVGTIATFSPLVIVSLWPNYGWLPIISSSFTCMILMPNCYMVCIGWLMLLPILLPYCTTFLGRPNFTGSRSWQFIRNNTFLWGSIERYFQGYLTFHK
jgi:hypothetical protein